MIALRARTNQLPEAEGAIPALEDLGPADTPPVTATKLTANLLCKACQGRLHGSRTAIMLPVPPEARLPPPRLARANPAN